jgi:transposase-like protein
MATAPAKPKRSRPGRPSALERTVGQRPDGTPITVYDRVEETLRIGGYIEDAAARCGIAASTFYKWRREGERLQQAIEAGVTSQTKLTATEKDCLRFAETVAKAQAEGELLLLGQLERLARGGIEQTTTTVKVDGDGNEIERTTKTSHTLPNVAAITWRLEKAHPHKWGRHRVEITGADGGPIQVSEDRAETLADRLEAYLAGVTDTAKGATQDG